ncbi:MAG: rod shape-determining protein MreC [Clostridiales bacterium]|nr:rod shape-determining protein MreC [Clostridiales bacterium]
MKDFFKGFGFKVLAAIALVLVGIMIYAASTGGMATIPAMLSGAIMTPLQTAASAVSDGFQSFVGIFTDSGELRKENDRLQEEVDKYRQQQIELDELRRQNEYLNEYLRIVESDSSVERASARVIDIDPADKYCNFTINAGTLSGISVNDPVITPQGLAGVVYETGLNYAKVRSILDPATQVSAAISRSGENGMTSGTLSLAKDFKLKLGLLSKEGDTEVGDIIITSGKGGIFPANLPIGEVEEIVPESDGVTLYARIKPYTDFGTLSQVLVITSFGGQGETVD